MIDLIVSSVLAGGAWKVQHTHADMLLRCRAMNAYAVAMGMLYAGGWL